MLVFCFQTLFIVEKMFPSSTLWLVFGENTDLVGILESKTEKITKKRKYLRDTNLLKKLFIWFFCNLKPKNHRLMNFSLNIRICIL